MIICVLLPDCVDFSVLPVWLFLHFFTFFDFNFKCECSLHILLSRQRQSQRPL